MIDPMYQYSLEFFARLFNRRLEKSKKSDKLEERLAILLDDITQSFYINICRGLFERDKLLYSFLNTTQILRRAEKIGVAEWNFYLRGSAENNPTEPNPLDFVNEATYFKIFHIEKAHPNFVGLLDSFKDAIHAETWKKMMVSEDPISIPMPDPFDKTLSPFQKLVVKILREEKVVQAIKYFVGEELG